MNIEVASLKNNEKLIFTCFNKKNYAGAVSGVRVFQFYRTGGGGI